MQAACQEGWADSRGENVLKGGLPRVQSVRKRNSSRPEPDGESGAGVSHWGVAQTLTSPL